MKIIINNKEVEVSEIQIKQLEDESNKINVEIELSGEVRAAEEEYNKLVELLGLEKIEESLIFEPEEGDSFWSLNSWGETMIYTHDGDEVDKFYESIGNVARTTEEAEEFKKTGWVAFLQAHRRIKKKMVELGLWVEPNWEDDLGKYDYYDHVCEEHSLPPAVNVQTLNTIYLRKQEDLEILLKHCKEDLDILRNCKL